MCIAIFKPADKSIKKKVLKHCFEQNPDGAGFSLPGGKRGILVCKGLFTFRQFWNEYRKVKDQKKPIIIHFRVSTCGGVDGENCHPWRINDNYAMIHNGVLAHKIGVEHESISDSGLFAANIIKPIMSSGIIWKKPYFVWLIEKSIGENNKVVILSNTGKHQIFNEDKGEWVDGVWFSNDTYKTERKKKVYTPTFQKSASSAEFPLQNKVLSLPLKSQRDIINKEAPHKLEPKQIDLTQLA